jgi:hypothetical protein
MPFYDFASPLHFLIAQAEIFGLGLEYLGTFPFVTNELDPVALNCHGAWFSRIMIEGYQIDKLAH